ncbi:MAG TPA: SDR family oxidoreductase [Steroidobacteraceae bacterium]|nr:SDR family oxidoreductase [Steroidobacteraceae bacterium]
MSSEQSQTVLIFGATGMLGSAMLRYFSMQQRYAVYGSVRLPAALGQLPAALRQRVVTGVEVENPDSIARAFAVARPSVVINCVGLIKQLDAAKDPLAAIPINSLLPHRLARLCAIAGATLVHFSTDCVFAGRSGMYREDDPADATDLYGRSKYLGEVAEPHTVTLRTSIIGHELHSAHGLVGWFLAQQGTVRGYRKAIFSGLPTVEMARVVHDFVLPNAALRGLYHVSAEPIDKYTLLRQVAQAYGKQIEIIPDDAVVLDRSLDSARFRAASGYTPPPWPELIERMRQFG